MLPQLFAGSQCIDLKQQVSKLAGQQDSEAEARLFTQLSARQNNEPEQRVIMKITIQGQDYTAALDAVRPLTIERKINEPSVCQLWLSLPANGSLAAPARFQSLAVTGDDGTTISRVTLR